MQGQSPARVRLRGHVLWSITHAPGADGQSECLHFRLAAASSLCSHGPIVPRSAPATVRWGRTITAC